MSKVPGSAHLNLTLGGLTMAGGAMGYFRKSSKMSLLAGMAFGGALMGSGYMIAKTDHIYEAHALATGATGFMALSMGSRYLKTSKVMPAGVVAVVGTAACAYNYTKMIEWAP